MNAIVIILMKCAELRLTNKRTIFCLIEKELSKLFILILLVNHINHNIFSFDNIKKTRKNNLLNQPKNYFIFLFVVTKKINDNIIKNLKR